MSLPGGPVGFAATAGEGLGEGAGLASSANPPGLAACPVTGAAATAGLGEAAGLAAAAGLGEAAGEAAGLAAAGLVASAGLAGAVVGVGVPPPAQAVPNMLTTSSARQPCRKDEPGMRTWLNVSRLTMPSLRWGLDPKPPTTGGRTREWAARLATDATPGRGRAGQDRVPAPERHYTT